MLVNAMFSGNLLTSLLHCYSQWCTNCGTLTWWRHRCCLGILLFGGSFHLVDDWLWVNATTVKMALKSQQVLGVVFPQCVGRTWRGTYTQETCDVLPCLVLRYLYPNTQGWLQRCAPQSYAQPQGPRPRITH